MQSSVEDEKDLGPREREERETGAKENVKKKKGKARERGT